MGESPVFFGTYVTGIYHRTYISALYTYVYHSYISTICPLGGSPRRSFLVEVI